MSTLAILPIKSFNAAKQRLVPGLSSGSSAAAGRGHALRRARRAPPRGVRWRPRLQSPPTTMPSASPALTARCCFQIRAVVTTAPPPEDRLRGRAGFRAGPARAGRLSRARPRRGRRTAQAPGAGAKRAGRSRSSRHRHQRLATRLLPTHSNPSFGPGSCERHIELAAAAASPASWPKYPRSRLM